METPPMTRRRSLGLVARGLAMGAADVVPGVSGGTMAFILGIYPELIEALRRIGEPATIRHLFRGELRHAISRIPWGFLGSLGLGIGIAVASLSRLIEILLDQYPSLLWAFFFGLVVASVITVFIRVGTWSAGPISAGLLGAVVGFVIVGLVPTTTPDDAWFFFIAGFVAICAMILPGISGSFVLVLLGKYQQVLAAVNDFNLVILGLVASGAVVGIVSFAQVLGWMFRRFHDVTVAALIGFIVGSLRKIWPWKETIRTVLDRHGNLVPVQQVNVIPDGWTSNVTWAVILAVMGFVVVIVLDRLARETT
jgi:putative membrane protein